MGLPQSYKPTPVLLFAALCMNMRKDLILHPRVDHDTSMDPNSWRVTGFYRTTTSRTKQPFMLFFDYTEENSQNNLLELCLCCLIPAMIRYSNYFFFPVRHMMHETNYCKNVTFIGRKSIHHITRAISFITHLHSQHHTTRTHTHTYTYKYRVREKYGISSSNHKN